MQFSFNLLRIKGLYTFRALFAYPQEVLQKQHLVYCVRMSVGRCTVEVKLQPYHSQLTLYARNIPNAIFVAPPDDKQIMLETCRSPWLSINWMKSVSRWFNYTDILWGTVSKTLSLTYDYLQKASCFVYIDRTWTVCYTSICTSSKSFTSDQDVPSFRSVCKIAKSDH
jgi:hypothetical protein